MNTNTKHGKRGKTGMHGNHFRGEKVKRKELLCAYCNSKFYKLESFLRQHPETKYCSRKCMGLDNYKPESHVTTRCNECGKIFNKRKDHLKENNYCSRVCSAKAKMVDGARWRDKKQIKQYMKDYQNNNRDEINERSRKWNNENKEKRLSIQAKYRRTHKDEIKVIHTRRYHAKLDGDLTPKQWKGIVEKHKHACVMCGEKEPKIKLTLDHIIPLSKGGKHTASNIQPLCKSCNSRKGNKIL